MDDEKQRIIKEGNAFYELDLECMRQKEEKRNRKEKADKTQKKAEG